MLPNVKIKLPIQTWEDQMLIIIITMLGSGVAQLAKRSLPTPEWFESHHRQSLYWILNTVYCQLYWKDKYKEKGAGNGPFFIITMQNSANNYGSLSSSKLCGLPNLTRLENGINLTLRSRGGQVVSVLAFYSVDLSLNTAEKSTILLYINC